MSRTPNHYQKPMSVTKAGTPKPAGTSAVTEARRMLIANARSQMERAARHCSLYPNQSATPLIRELMDSLRILSNEVENAEQPT